jgi:hypothetical protein
LPDRIASSTGTFESVRTVRNVIVLAALGFVISATAPARAGAGSTCDWKTAAAYRAAGDRYHDAHDYGRAARWYLAATRLTRDCRSVEGTLLSAHLLAQAGAALAQSGDDQSALEFLHAAQSKLESLTAANAQTAAAARSYSELVQNVISAVDEIARASM